MPVALGIHIESSPSELYKSRSLQRERYREDKRETERGGYWWAEKRRWRKRWGRCISRSGTRDTQSYDSSIKDTCCIVRSSNRKFIAPGRLWKQPSQTMTDLINWILPPFCHHIKEDEGGCHTSHISGVGGSECHILAYWNLKLIKPIFYSLPSVFKHLFLSHWCK